MLQVNCYPFPQAFVPVDFLHENLMYEKLVYYLNTSSGLTDENQKIQKPLPLSLLLSFILSKSQNGYISNNKLAAIIIR